ncbi:histidine phosphatase family protein [Nocardioides terrisoli]|uniref:histidine phosphatase family protein n=1 Tax=Nocardioides terrisoli TaxID=3388267 RepID=UPI00287B8730|nr:histidine phosphatase family protein [Nocardioides marmorisolisilvae]
MGQILLVRHGQASWGAVDYDVLSPTGEEQAAVLGRFLTALAPELIVHGTMKRQQRTAEIAAEAAGWSAPLSVDERWNEMDHPAILAAHPQQFDGEPDRHQFQAWFEAATDRWTAGDHDHEYDEPYPAFVRRVGAALAEIAGSGTAVVFTSGGPIASATTELLGADVATYGLLAPVVVNTSVTRVVSGRRGLTLVSFNEHAHLQHDRRLLTYR